MDLYLIRHAEAVPLAEGDSDDASRPLTDLGRAQAAQVGRVLRQRGITLDKLYTSPLVRARQTAELLGPNMPPLEECVALAPKAKPRKLGRFLLKQGGERVGLVGHMPQLAEFAGWLIGGKNAQLALAKSGIACIVCGEAPGKGFGVLQWLVSPLWFGE